MLSGKLRKGARDVPESKYAHLGMDRTGGRRKSLRKSGLLRHLSNSFSERGRERICARVLSPLWGRSAAQVRFCGSRIVGGCRAAYRQTLRNWGAKGPCRKGGA